MAVAVVAVLPSLGDPMVLDDYLLGVYQRSVTGIDGLAGRSWWNLYSFTTGVPEANRALIDQGVLLPWWTDTRHFYVCFRPISSLLHWVDFRFWPASPFLMRLHSLFWYAAVLAAVAWLYQQFSPAPWFAGLAFFVYALDDAHGANVGWISGPTT